MKEPHPTPLEVSWSGFLQTVLDWPLQAQIGIGVGFAIWIVGGNLLLFRNMRRAGTSRGERFRPKLGTVIARGKKDTAVVIIGIIVLMALSIGLMAWGVSALVDDNVAPSRL